MLAGRAATPRATDSAAPAAAAPSTGRAPSRSRPATDRGRPAERERDQHRALRAQDGDEEPQLAVAVGAAALDLGRREVVALGHGRRLDRPIPGPQQPHGRLRDQDHRHGRGPNPHDSPPAGGAGHVPTIFRPARATGDPQRYPREPSCPGGGACRRRGRRPRDSSGALATWSATERIRTSAPALSPSAASSAWWETTTWRSSASSTTHPSLPRRPPPCAGPGRRPSPRRSSSCAGWSRPTRAARWRCITPRRGTPSGSTCFGPTKPRSASPFRRRGSA